MPARKDRTGTWRFQKVVRLPDGTKQRISGTPSINTKGDAEREERAAIARALAAPEHKQAIPTFAELAARYMEVHERDLSPAEIAFKRRKLKSLLNPLFGHVRADMIGRAELDEIKIAMKARAPRTVNNTLSCVGAILAYGVKLRHLVERPDLGLLPVPPQDFEVFPDHELEQIVATSSGFELAGVLLGADAGLRMGEIRALRREDVGAGKLRVAKSDYYGTLKAPKSGLARVVPMNARLSQAVTWALAQHSGPFVLARDVGGRWGHEKGQRWTYEVQRAIIARVCERAGVPNRGWHALRHAFGSRLAARGVPAIVIQALMGHESITTTQRYLHVASDALEAATSLLERPTQRAYGMQNEAA